MTSFIFQTLRQTGNYGFVEEGGGGGWNGKVRRQNTGFILNFGNKKIRNFVGVYQEGVLFQGSH